MRIGDFDQEDDVINLTTSIPPTQSNYTTAKGTVVFRNDIALNTNFLNGKTTLSPREFSRLLLQALSKGDLAHVWSDNGMPCRVIQNSQPWQNGKIVISVEFIPDQPVIQSTNTLDSLRN